MQEEIYKNLSLEDLPGEVWKDVVGYEGLYQVSNLGRVKSLKREIPFKNTTKVIKERILAQYLEKGYCKLSLSTHKKSGSNSIRVHRLVYEAFIGYIPKGKLFHIHHKDGDRKNNSVENLKLITIYEHNILHKRRHLVSPVTNESINVVRGNIGKSNNRINALIAYNKQIRPKNIVQKDMNGDIISIYNNGKEASDATGVCQRNILQVASKTPFNDKGSVRKQAGGFIWEYLE